VDGNAYIQKVRNRGNNQVVELWWLPHYRVFPTWPDDGSAFIDGYLVTVDGAQYRLPPEDIIHVRDGIDPLNDRCGLSALKACVREACGLNFAAGYTAALLKNSGVPGIAIVPDGPDGETPDDTAARRIEQKFVERFANDQVGKPIVFTGRYKVTEVGFSPAKLGLGDLTLEMEMRLAAAMGTALMSLGLRDPNKTYANLGEANRTSWGTICSIQELIAEAVQQQLFPDFGLDPVQNVFAYDYSEIQELQESLDAIHTRTRNDFRFDLLTKNEARELLGFEPVEGDKGDVFFSDIQAAIASAKAPDAGGPGGSDSPDATEPTDRSPTDTGPRSEGPASAEPRPGKALALNGDGHHPRWEY
jgi:phage portal protein BeeE